MRQLLGQQHEQRYHRCSTSVSTSPVAGILRSSCCSCHADAVCASLGNHHLGRRRRRRPSEQRGESEHLPGTSSSGSGGSGIQGVSRGTRRNRRREGSGLAISVVLFASSTAAATAVVPAGPELPPSTMASRSALVHDASRPTRLNRTAFVSSATAAAGIEPVRRWAAAGCRRLAGATHQNAAAAAAAVTAGLTGRTTGFLRGGLRGGSAGAGGSSSGGGGLRMISGGFSGEFTPPDESWKRRRAEKQQQEEEPASPLLSQSPTRGQLKSVARDGDGEEEEEEEVFAWTPKQNGQGSWDSRNALVGGRAADKDDGPVWRVDLKRGVYTGDVKIKQVLS